METNLLVITIKILRSTKRQKGNKYMVKQTSQDATRQVPL